MTDATVTDPRCPACRHRRHAHSPAGCVMPADDRPGDCGCREMSREVSA